LNYIPLGEKNIGKWIDRRRNKLGRSRPLSQAVEVVVVDDDDD
jgi:hypothetical protein